LQSLFKSRYPGADTIRVKPRFGLLVALLSGLASPCAASAENLAGMAPVDEYFGPQHISPLGITNRIRDAERRGSDYRGLLATQAAIEDWTRKYPGDPWIPPREFRMSHLFARLHSRDGSAEASWCRAYLRVHFQGTRYAVAAEREGRPNAKRSPARHKFRKRHRVHRS
jgi:hypothetical protein